MAQDADGRRTTRRWAIAAVALVVVAVLVGVEVLARQPPSAHVAGRCVDSPTALVVAAANGDEDGVRRGLADRPADAPDEDGYRPLYCAVANDRRATAGLLLDAGAQPDLDSRAEDSTRSTPLVIAATTNRTALVTLLLDHRADPDHPGGDRLPLENAIANRATDSVRLLLDRGADPNLSIGHGRPLTLLAANHPDVELAGLLLDHGAEINAVDDTSYGFCPDLSAFSTDNCSTALAAAIFADDDPFVRFLLDRGSDPSDGLYAASAHRDAAATALLLERGAVADAHRTNTALLYDVVFGNDDLVRLLLDHGADPDLGGPGEASTMSLGFAALTALGDAQAISHPDAVRKLACTVRGHATNVPPIVLAAALGRTSSVERLLAHGADPSLPADFETPVDARAAARLTDRPDVLALLDAAGATDVGPVTVGSVPPGTARLASC